MDIDNVRNGLLQACLRLISARISEEQTPSHPDNDAEIEYAMDYVDEMAREYVRLLDEGQ